MQHKIIERLHHIWLYHTDFQRVQFLLENKMLFYATIQTELEKTHDGKNYC